MPRRRTGLLLARWLFPGDGAGPSHGPVAQRLGAARPLSVAGRWAVPLPCSTVVPGDGRAFPATGSRPCRPCPGGSRLQVSLVHCAQGSGGVSPEHELLLCPRRCAAPVGVACSAARGGNIAGKQPGAGAFVSLAHWRGLGEREKHSSGVPACSESFFAQNSCGPVVLGLGFCGCE